MEFAIYITFFPNIITIPSRLNYADFQVSKKSQDFLPHDSVNSYII